MFHLTDSVVPEVDFCERSNWKLWIEVTQGWNWNHYFSKTNASFEKILHVLKG